jgi:peptide/nickel transport system permease protein
MAAQASVTTSRVGHLLTIPRRARRLRLPWIPLSIVTILLICATFAPLLTPYDPTEVSILDSRMAPGASLSHPLGTDALGRDILTRLIYGARTTIFISLVALSAGAVVGTALGLIAGYRGGWPDIPNHVHG